MEKNNGVKNLTRSIYNIILKRGISGITSTRRVLPDFIIIGTVRSGSTSLYYNICSHPSILPASYDEIGFFDSNYHLGMNWYRSMFPLKSDMERIRSETKYALTGEDTPFYFWKIDAANRIRKILPKIKLITILRNPVQRAYSNYYLGVREGTEKLTFEEAVRKELDTLPENKILAENIFKFCNVRRSYIAKSLYVYQMKIWFERFSKNRLFVISTEEMSKSPAHTMNQAYEFLGLPKYENTFFEKRKKASYEKMGDNIRKELEEFFKPHNEELFKLIGKSFDW
jgi:hypothetical protein